MGTVQLYAVKSCCLATFSTDDEIFDKLLNFCHGQRPGPSFLVLRRTDWRLTDEPRWRADSCVVKLDDAEGQGARPRPYRLLPAARHATCVRGGVRCSLAAGA